MSERSAPAGVPAATRSGARKARHLVDEHRPGRLVGQRDVVVAVQGHQPGARDPRGQLAAQREVDHAVAAGVQHEGRHAEPRQQVADVGPHPTRAGPHGVLGRGRAGLQGVEPARLLLGRPGDQEVGEHPPERAVGPCPAHLDHLLEGVLQLHGLRVGVVHCPPVRAVEDQAGESSPMARRVRDADGPALRHAHHREPFQPGGVGDGLEVGDPRFEAEVGDVPVRHPVAALVVADHGGDPAEVEQEMPPHRALPVVLEVAEPAGGEDQRRPAAVDGVGDARAVRAAAEPDVLRRRLARPGRPRHSPNVVPRRGGHHDSRRPRPGPRWGEPGVVRKATFPTARGMKVAFLPSRRRANRPAIVSNGCSGESRGVRTAVAGVARTRPFGHSSRVASPRRSPCRRPVIETARPARSRPATSSNRPRSRCGCSPASGSSPMGSSTSSWPP